MRSVLRHFKFLVRGEIVPLAADGLSVWAPCRPCCSESGRSFLLAFIVQGCTTLGTHPAKVGCVCGPAGIKGPSSGDGVVPTPEGSRGPFTTLEEAAGGLFTLRVDGNPPVLLSPFLDSRAWEVDGLSLGWERI